MPISDIGQIAKSAIETGLALVKKTGEITPERAQTLFYALESDLAEAWQSTSITTSGLSGLSWTPLGDAATIKVGDVQVTIEDLVEAWKLREAVWTTAFINDLPDSSFALVLPGGEKNGEGKTKPRSLRKLPYKDANGKVDLPHLRNALARHSQMKGVSEAQQASALRKLQAAAKTHLKMSQEAAVDFSEAMTLNTVTGVLQFLLDQFGDQVEEPEPPEPPAQEPETEEMAEAEIAESISGTVSLAETGPTTGARAPLLMDIALIEPGWGNPKDNNYYSREMLERDAKVFVGAKMYTTDHRQGEKSVRTEVSQVQSITGFTPEGKPIARVAVHDPDFAEAARNRAALGTLNSLECSILAFGKRRPGEVDGKKGNIVEAITRVQSVDWVTRAGAGGHALNLAENSGGETMSEEQKGVPPEEEKRVEEQEVIEVLLSENAIQTVLGGSNLPDLAKQRLAIGEYETKEKLEEAITAEVDYLKAITGSGKPFGQGASQPVEVRVSEVDLQKNLEAIDARYGLQEVSNA